MNLFKHKQKDAVIDGEGLEKLRAEYKFNFEDFEPDDAAPYPSHWVDDDGVHLWPHDEDPENRLTAESLTRSQDPEYDGGPGDIIGAAVLGAEIGSAISSSIGDIGSIASTPSVEFGGGDGGGAGAGGDF